MRRTIIFLIVIALAVGVTGCIPPSRNLTVSSSQGGKVVTPGEGTFTCYGGRGVILMALSDTNYHFVNWTGDVCNIGDVNSAVTTIHMDCDSSIMANFAVGRWRD